MNRQSITLILGLLCLTTATHAGIARVWVCDDGERIRKTDLDLAIAANPDTSIWRNNTITLFGLRNEIVAFQVIIQADGQGASAVNVSVSDLTNGASTIPGSAAGAASPYDYRGKSVELFTEHYESYPTATSGGLQASMTPDGWVPDCLIPFSAKQGLGGAPFAIDANANQGVWVDVLIPRGAPAGTYTGMVTVTAGAATVKQMPLSLRVYSPVLPDTTHLMNFFYYEPSRVAEFHSCTLFDSTYRQIEQRYWQMAHRHRMNLIAGAASLAEMPRFKPLLTGAAFTTALQYQGPGENTGNPVFAINDYGRFSSEFGWTQSAWQSGLDAWETWFRANAPFVRRFVYLYPDEPWIAVQSSPTVTDSLKLQAQWTHNDAGAGKAVPTLCTDIFDQALKGAVDIWSHPAGGWIDPGFAASEKAAGRAWGFYNGSRPYSGYTSSTEDAVDFRVIPWIVRKYGADHYYFWETTYWESNGGILTDPIIPPGSSGDGVMFYPGQESTHPDQDRGLAGPMPSIRMKSWRRGVQDMEYVWLLQQAGRSSDAAGIISACVPKALWDTDNNTKFSWSVHGYGFEKYRRQMAELLAATVGVAQPAVRAKASNRLSERLLRLDGRELYTGRIKMARDHEGSAGVFLLRANTGLRKVVNVPTGR